MKSMAGLSWASLVSLAAMVAPTSAQQFSGGVSDLSFLQVSQNCMNALNTVVNCPLGLGSLAVQGGMIDSDGAAALCTQSCADSLRSVRSTIAGACTQGNDKLVINDVQYPATFFADQYLYAYSLACRKDSQTGQYCDPQLLAWSTQGELNSTQSCSDCWLGVQALQLNSPFGYDDAVATDFASLTSSCGATQGYVVTSPTAYAFNATATTPPQSVPPTPAPTCTGSYTVKATDDCNSVAKTLNVSTYNLLYDNNLDIYCQNFGAVVNQSLCIPPTCSLYTWRAIDTCASVVSQYPGMTIPQFLAWNSNFNDLCQNAGGFDGYQVCLSPPGGYLNGTSTINSTAPSIATTAAPVPTGAAPDSNQKCGLWYKIRTGDTCSQVSMSQGIALKDFYFLNPEIWANCTNLQLDLWYCVEAVGDISTYQGYPKPTGSITVPPASFSSVNTAIPTTSVSPYTYTPSQMPTAPGSASGCSLYANYDASVNKQSGCDYWAFAYHITFDQLVAWNPSLSSDVKNCTLQNDYSYCVQQSNTTNVITPNYCLPVNSSTIMSGTTPSCKCYTTVKGYYNGAYLCSDIQVDFNITSTQLTTWNSWLASNCDSALYAGLGAYDQRPVCIGLTGPATPTSPTNTTSSTTSSTTTSSTTTSMGPTASGEVAGCQKHYTVKSGDTCAAVLSANSITFDQFYQWNPSVGSNCENLNIGLAYCVSGPTSTTQPTGPTASGEVAGCQKHYTVKLGDTCGGILTANSITFDQFYSWNPSVGSNCQSLNIGLAYCVQGPGNSPPTGPPAPTQPGISPNCSKYHVVVLGDTCNSIQVDANISITQFYDWNPAVGTDCKALQVGYAVCIGVTL